MKKIFLLILLFNLFNLVDCQQTSNKKTNGQNDINAILTNITIDALKDSDVQLANRSINAMVLSNDDKVWDFLQSAILSLPSDASDHIIKSALTLDSVNNSPVQLFAIAKIYIAKQETQQALDIINQAIELDNKNLDVIYWRARLLTIMQDFTKAETDFKYITKKDPGNQEYIGQYASYLQETKQFDKAQQMLAKQKITPKGLFKRIIFSLQNKNHNNANNLYEQLKSLKVVQEDQNQQFFLIADAAYWLKKYAQSEEYYRKVTGGEHYLAARDMVSLILFEDKRYDEAIEILHQLQNANKSVAIKAYRLETQIYRDQNNTAKAIQTLNRSLEMLPNNPELLLDRAMLYESIKQIDKAEKDLLQILKDNPNNYNALNTLGYSLADNDLKLKQAYQYIKRAIELEPNSPAILDSLGWVQYKLGEIDKAEKNIKRAIDMAIEQNQNDVELYVHLYQILIKQNKITEAAQILVKANELFPDDQQLLNLTESK
ncbi:MAG: tetratricopeptide repeat protein [Proteobacteria bacterium]|nr:tetratricopeptide repeat protein [Pseudomonadota bacterium]